ncbi:hypothetical protein MMC28_007711 [Mycoblastus sanguinarius]|nr:hypothetical protein [Mycoblastus sanguinarius]
MASISKTEHAAAVKKMRHATTARMSTPVVRTQRETTVDREAKGPSWVSRVVFSAPAEDDILQIICNAVNDLGVGDERYAVPALADVRAQWTGFRARVPKNEPEPLIPEAKKLDYLMSEVSSPLTILYAYGGNH